MIKYKKINKENENEVKNLIENVISNLDNKDFFMKIEQEELLNLFNEQFAILYGAFDSEKLVGMAGMFISGDHLKDLKLMINLHENNIAELRAFSCFK